MSQYVETICADVHQQLYQTVLQQIELIFCERIAEVDIEINKLTWEKGRLQQDQADLMRVISELA